MLNLPEKTPGKTDVIVMEFEQWKEFLTEWLDGGNLWGKNASMEEMLRTRSEETWNKIFRDQVPEGQRIAFSISRPGRTGQKLNLGWCWEGWYKQQSRYILHEYDQIHIATKDMFDDIFGILNKKGGSGDAEAS